MDRPWDRMSADFMFPEKELAARISLEILAQSAKQIACRPNYEFESNSRIICVMSKFGSVDRTLRERHDWMVSRLDLLHKTFPSCGPYDANDSTNRFVGLLK
jgi:hypothetical protein